jgi:predicted secreted protein
LLRFRSQGRIGAMTISSALAIYFIVWWVVLFAVLPFGVRSQHEDGPGAAGTDPGAPVAHGMVRKLIWTTIISAIVFGLGMWANRIGILNVDNLSRLMGFRAL